MPLALEPEQTILISLKTDADKPQECRPAFRVRFLSGRDRRRVREKIDAALQETDDDRAEQLVLEAIQIGLVGWEHISQRDGLVLPYDPARLPELLTDLELWELVGLLLHKTRLAETDLKNLGSPSGAATTASAEAAPA